MFGQSKSCGLQHPIIVVYFSMHGYTRYAKIYLGRQLQIWQFWKILVTIFWWRLGYFENATFKSNIFWATFGKIGLYLVTLVKSWETKIVSLDSISFFENLAIVVFAFSCNLVFYLSQPWPFFNFHSPNNLMTKFVLQICSENAE